MIFTDGELPRLSKAQQIYQSMVVSGRVLWNDLMKNGRLTLTVTVPSVNDENIKILNGVLERIGDNIFVFRFDDGSQLVVNPYSIEVQWGVRLTAADQVRAHITANDLHRFFFLLERDRVFIECFVADHPEDNSAPERFTALANELEQTSIEAVQSGRHRVTFKDGSSLVFGRHCYFGET